MEKTGNARPVAREKKKEKKEKDDRLFLQEQKNSEN